MYRNTQNLTQNNQAGKVGVFLYIVKDFVARKGLDMYCSKPVHI